MAGPSAHQLHPPGLVGHGGDHRHCGGGARSDFLTVVLFFWLRVPTGGALGILAICAAIPLLIAPPISFFALSVLRLLTVTIDRVDAYVRFDTLTGS